MLGKANKSAVLARLMELKRRHGNRFKPEHILRDARDHNSPLHPVFEWDDAVGAESWRLHQARMLITQVVVSIEEDGKTRAPVKVFHSVVVNEERVIEDLETIMSDEELRAQLLNQCLTDMKRFQLKFENLREVGDVIRAMRRAAPAIARRTRRRRRPVPTG